MRINEGWAEEQAIREAIMRCIFPVPEEEPEPEELLSLGPNRTRQKPLGTVVADYFGVSVDCLLDDEIEIQEYIRIEQEEKKMQIARNSKKDRPRELILHGEPTRFGKPFVLAARWILRKQTEIAEASVCLFFVFGLVLLMAVH